MYRHLYCYVCNKRLSGDYVTDDNSSGCKKLFHATCHKDYLLVKSYYSDFLLEVFKQKVKLEFIHIK